MGCTKEKVVELSSILRERGFVVSMWNRNDYSQEDEQSVMLVRRKEPPSSLLMSSPISVVVFNSGKLQLSDSGVMSVHDLVFLWDETDKWVPIISSVLGEGKVPDGTHEYKEDTKKPQDASARPVPQPDEVWKVIASLSRFGFDLQSPSSTFPSSLCKFLGVCRDYITKDMTGFTWGEVLAECGLSITATEYNVGEVVWSSPSGVVHMVGDSSLRTYCGIYGRNEGLITAKYDTKPSAVPVVTCRTCISVLNKVADGELSFELNDKELEDAKT